MLRLLIVRTVLVTSAIALDKGVFEITFFIDIVSRKLLGF